MELVKKINQCLNGSKTSYIEHNTKMRQEADNKFDEDQAKLMNNSFFGKFFF